MKIKYIFSWIILLLIFNTAFGQKKNKTGYIITNENDTLYGIIHLRSNYNNSKNCEFQKKDDKVNKMYSPSEIKAYRIDDNKYYLSKEVILNKTNKQVFLEYLVNGIVDLYYLKEPENEYFFIEKDSTMVLLSNELYIVESETGVKYYKNSDQYKGVLRYLFNDSPDLKNNITNTGFDFSSLIDITKDYHYSVCKDFECIDYTKSDKNVLFLEPNTGIINSWMGLETSKDYATDLKPYIGVNLRFKPTKMLYLWNFIIGLNYSKNDFFGDYVNSLYVKYTYTTRISLKYSVIRLPIIVEYSFPTDKIQPFISLSYNNVFIINPDYEVTRGNNNNITEETEFRNYQFGLSIGLGIKYNLNSSSYLYLKNEFEYRRPSANFRYVLDYHYVYSWLISFGYGFNINK